MDYIVDILRNHGYESKEPLIELGNCCNSRAFSYGEWIVKLPVGRASLNKIRKEVRILKAIKGKVPFISQAEMIEGFSVQKRLSGVPIISEVFDTLSDTEREHLAEDIASFLASLHSISPHEVDDLPKWDRFDKLFASKRTMAKTIVREEGLTEQELSFLLDFLEEYFEMKGNVKEVFGHFDVLKKNVLVNPAKKKLVGICDFGDSGRGRRIYEFSNIDIGNVHFLARIVSAYAKKTNTKLSFQEVRMHALFSRLAFHVNFLNGIEKIQKTTLEKLKREMASYREKV